jgi:hypothetical protein
MNIEASKAVSHMLTCSKLMRGIYLEHCREHILHLDRLQNAHPPIDTSSVSPSSYLPPEASTDLACIGALEVFVDGTLDIVTVALLKSACNL